MHSSTESLLATQGLVPQELVPAPSYSPSELPPKYSPSPVSGEQRVQYRCRGSRSDGTTSALPNGVHTTKKHGITVVLTGQEENVDIPHYSGIHRIEGIVSLDERDSVTEIAVKLEGTLKATVTRPIAVDESSKMINDQYILWKQDPSGDHHIPEVAPGSIPFSITIPETFKDNTGSPRALPPSHDIGYVSDNGFRTKATYRLVVSITKRRKLPFGKIQTLNVPIQFVPRRRPNLPTISDPYLFSSVKASPEEWLQSVSEMKARANSDFSSIQSHLFVPSVQVFAFTDKIPFHLQLSGSQKSLRELVTVPSSSKSSHTSTTEMPTIQVTLHRDVIVNVSGQKSWKSTIIGHGTIASLPPPADLDYSLHTSGRDISLDWEGEIQANKDIHYGGFYTGTVSVKDWIVIHVVPPQSHKSSFLPLRAAIPIRLVTDPYDSEDSTRSWG